MAKWKRFWKRPASKRRANPSRRSAFKGRYLSVETLEPRLFLSVNQPTVSDLLAKQTPNPHPTGDQPSDTATAITLSTYNPVQITDPHIDVLESYIQGEQQIESNIESNPAARPSYWGETSADSAAPYRLHLNDNGMLVDRWTINWGDGSAAQTVSNQPWVIHSYAGLAADYTVTVTASSVNGSFAASQGDGQDAAGLPVELSDVSPQLRLIGNQTTSSGDVLGLPNLGLFTHTPAPGEFTYSIDWGDGASPDMGDATIVDQGSADSPMVGTVGGVHTYTTGGDYYIAVTVTDPSGGSDTQTLEVTVNQSVTVTPVQPAPEPIPVEVVTPPLYADPGTPWTPGTLPLNVSATNPIQTGGTTDGQTVLGAGTAPIAPITIGGTVTVGAGGQGSTTVPIAGLNPNAPSTLTTTTPTGGTPTDPNGGTATTPPGDGSTNAPATSPGTPTGGTSTLATTSSASSTNQLAAGATTNSTASLLGNTLLSPTSGSLAPAGVARSFSMVDTTADSDPALLAAVRQALAIPAGAPVYDTDWARLTSLTADSNQVLSLEGLQYAVNLRSLTLVPGSFADPGHLSSLSRLSGLANLTSLTLQSCGITTSMLSSLTSLPALKTLDLRYNNLTSVTSPVAQLPALQSLYVYGNPLTDNPRAGLAALAGLLITLDIAPDHPENALKQYDPTDASTAQNVYNDLADAFYDLPLAIYSYVANTIKYVPYQGAVKGPLATLQTGVGNDWDTNSLLAVLLQRASVQAGNVGNPTLSVSYQWGRVLETISTTEQRLGVRTTAGVYDALAEAGLRPQLEDQNSTALSTTALSSAYYVSFDHAWLQVQVTPLGASLETFLLDPSWKLKDLQPGLTGVLSAVPFATNGTSGSYLSAPQNETAAEFYAAQVASWLATNHSSLTVADIPYDGPIHPQNFTSLPTSLPYAGLSGISTATTSIPAGFLATTRISVDIPQGTTTVTATYSSSTGLTTLVASGGTPFSAATANAPVLLDSTTGPQLFTISSVTSSTTVVVQGDASSYSGHTFWAPGLSSLQSIPTIALERLTIGYTGGGLTPELFINGGTPITSGLSATSGGNVDVIVQIAPADPYTDTVVFAGTNIYTRAAGKYLAIGIDAGQTSNQLLVADRKIVNDANIAEANNSSWASSSQQNEDQLAGGLLNLAMVNFYLNCDQQDAMVGGLTGAMPVYNCIADGVATADSALSATSAGNNSQLQIQYLPTSMGIDVAGANWNSTSTDEALVQCPAGSLRGYSTEDQAHYAIMGYTSSAMEALVWEDLTNTNSISTSKSLEMAYRSSITVDTFTASNESTISTALSALSATIRSDIVGFITKYGGSVTVPTQTTTINNGTQSWTGVGYFVTNLAGIDVANIIDNGVDAPHGAWTGGNADSVSEVESPITIGDPIEISNGSVTHDETDISIPNLGTPLDFSRHYSSDTTVASGTAWSNRGMGEGWSFTYSDQIVAANSAIDGTQPSGTLVWFTDQGRRLVFTPKTGGGYNTPDGVYGALTHDTTNHHYVWTDDTGSVLTFDDSSGNLLSVLDRYGNGVIIDRNTSGQILDVHDAFDSTRRLTFTYTSGLITSIADFSGRTWTYAYSSAGRLVAVTAPISSTAPLRQSLYAYYAEGSVEQGLLQSFTDADGNVTQFSYYVNRRGFQVTDAAGNVTSVSHDIYRDRTDFTDQRGQNTSYVYDSNGYETQQVNPDWTTLAYTWSSGLKTSDTDEYGQTEHFVYADTNNPAGNANVTQFTDRLGNVTNTTYTTYSNVATVTRTVDSAETQYFYSTDGLGSLAKTIDAMGDITLYSYPSTDRGLPSGIMAPNAQANLEVNGSHSPYGYGTSYTYNEGGQVLTTQQAVKTYDPTVTPVQQSVSITQSFTYDTVGDLTSSTDGKLNQTTFVNDIYGDPISQTLPDPDGSGPLVAPVTTDTFDANANLLSTSVTTDDPIRTTSAAYDSLNRVVKSVNADGTYTTRQYDLAGNLVAETDAMGRVTGFVYDARNRLIDTIAPDGTVTSARYDGGSRVVAMTDALGNTIEYAYDKSGRKTETILPDPDGSGSLTAATTLTTYNDASDKVYVTDALGTGYTDTAHTTETDYDKLGRVTEVIEPTPATGVARPTTYTTYDLNSNVKTFTDARGEETTFYYDEDNRKTSEVQADPDGSGPLGNLTTQFVYDNNSNLVTVVNALGSGPTDAAHTVVYVFDNLNRQTEVTEPTDPSGNRPTTTTKFDQNGDVAATADALGNTTHYAHNLVGEETAVTDARGDVTSTIYDAVGNALLVTDALGRVTQFQYDALNRKTSETEPLPDWTTAAPPTATWQYDADSHVVAATDPDGNTTYTQYNGWNLPVAETDALGAYAGDPLHTVVTAYDELGRVSTVTDTLGRMTEYLYDNLGRKIEIIAPDPANGTIDSGSPRTYFGYDANGNLWFTTDALGSAAGDSGHTTWNFYDGLNRLTSTVDALAGMSLPSSDFTPSSRPSHGTLTTYDALGNIVTQTDQLGRVTTFVYDHLNRKIEEIDPDPSTGLDGTGSPITQFYHDANGNETEVTDADGHSTYTTFDALNRAVRTVSALGSSPNDTHYATVTTFDAVGNATSVTDPDGNVTSYVHDRLNRQTATINPLWTVATTEYDAAGNVIETTDADGRVTSFIYDPLNRQVEEDWLDASGSVIHATHTYYDSAGQVYAVVDPSATYFYQSDDDGRVVRSRTAPGDVTQPTSAAYTWTASATLSTSTYTSAIVTLGTYAQDLGATLAATVSHSGGSSHPMTVEFVSPTGKIVAATLSGGVYTATVNEQGYWSVELIMNPALTSDSFSLSVSETLFISLADLQYTFDTAGDQLTVSDSAGGITTNQFDVVHRLTQTEQTLGGTVNELANLTYFDDGSLHTVTRYGIGGALVATSTYGYDDDARLTSLNHTQGGTTLDDYTFGYDAASNITSQTSTLDSSGATDTFTLDASNQLDSASLTSESYAYDQNQNRTGGNAVIGADNRVLFDGTYTYQYDANGNVTAKFVDANHDGALDSGDTSVTLSSWDYRNRLVSVTIASTYGGSATTIGYTYNFADQRIRKTVTASGATSYDYLIYDGDKPLLDVADTTALPGGSPTVTDRYLNAAAVDQILADDQFAGSIGPMWLLPDQEGSARDLVAYASSTWALVTHQQFASFGALASATYYTTVHVTSQIGYASGITDANTGLIQFVHRWYDPTTGRFLGEDPADSTTNLYAYTGNNPADYIDPSGLCSDAVYVPPSSYSSPADLGHFGLSAPLFLPGNLTYPSPIQSALEVVASSEQNLPQGWTSDSYNAWFSSLEPRAAVGNEPENLFQRAVAGPTEYHVQGAGNAPVWADSVEGPTIIDAKMVTDPDISAQLGNANPFWTQKYRTINMDEFGRYKSAIEDPANPLNSVEVRVSMQEAVPYWESFLNDQGIPGKVVVAGANAPPQVEPTVETVLPQETGITAAGALGTAINGLQVYMVARMAGQEAGVLKPDYQENGQILYRFAAPDTSMFTIHQSWYWAPFVGSFGAHDFKRVYDSGPLAGQEESITSQQAQEYRTAAEKVWGHYEPGSIFTDPTFTPGTQRKSIPLTNQWLQTRGYIDQDGVHYYEENDRLYDRGA